MTKISTGDQSLSLVWLVGPTAVTHRSCYQFKMERTKDLKSGYILAEDHFERKCLGFPLVLLALMGEKYYLSLSFPVSG